MDSYQCSYGPAWTTPVIYPTQFCVHKENPICRRCGLVHYIIMELCGPVFYICALNVERMDILRGRARHRKLTAKVTFTPLKSHSRRITQARQRKENQRRKFNATETRSEFSTKNVYSLRNFLFPGLKTLNSMKSLLRINWKMRIRK